MKQHRSVQIACNSDGSVRSGVHGSECFWADVPLQAGAGALVLTCPCCGDVLKVTVRSGYAAAGLRVLIGSRNGLLVVAGAVAAVFLATGRLAGAGSATPSILGSALAALSVVALLAAFAVLPAFVAAVRLAPVSIAGPGHTLLRGRRSRPDAAPPAACPHCGSPVPVRAAACSDCGSDARTGWSESAWQPEVVGSPAGAEPFDYDAFVRREFGGGLSRSGGAGRRLKILWWVLAILLVLAMVWRWLR